MLTAGPPSPSDPPPPPGEAADPRRIGEALERRVRELSALYHLTDRLQRADTMEAVYDAALDAILAGLRGDRASILLLDGSGIMKFVGWRGLSESYRHAVEGHSPWSRDDGNPPPICCPDVETAGFPDPLKKVVQGEGIGALAFIPLVEGGSLIGKFMVYFNAPHAFTEDDIEVALNIGRQLAFGIGRKRTERALRENESRLREADRRKDEFLAILAHELRNPLAPLHSSLQILKRTGLTDPVQDQARLTMERQLGQLVRLVDDLLDVSRITRGKIDLRKETVDLVGIVDHAVEAIRPLSDQKHHRILVSMPEIPVWVHADSARLSQVVGNLVHNASKFTGPGGGIHLNLETSGGEAVLHIHDTGIGIGPEHLPRVFDMFAQASTSVERATGGLGIGLMLVKTLIEMHGGRVEAHSEGPGEGSTFVVRLPLAARAPSPRATDEARPLGDSRRILVVDDNQDAAETMARILKLLGHATHTAFDGPRAIQAAEDFRPDLVLLDLGMPRYSGYEVARAIRSRPWGTSMVLAAVTGWGQTEDRRKSREAGFDYHFTKPVDPETLAALDKQKPEETSPPASV